MPELIAADLETFYDQKEYTLRKQTVEEYIRDARFETIMGAMYHASANKGTCWWIGGEDGGPLKRKLDAVDWDDVILTAWNAHFDGAILAWRYGKRPKAIVCAMQMWQAMGYHRFGGASLAAATKYAIANGWKNIRPKGNEVENASGKRLRDFTHEELVRYGHYCEDDAWNCYWLTVGMMERGFPSSEMLAMSESIRCFTEPRILLDTTRLAEINVAKKRQQQLLMAQCGIEQIEDLRSDDKFAVILQAAGVDPPTKKNAKGQTKWAFAKGDAEFQELLEHEDDTVVALVEARMGTKSTITVSRTQRLHDISQRGRWPIYLNFGGAHTLRFSGGDKTNPQNLGKKDGIRDCLIAPPGFVYVVRDKSQIEARLVAYVAGQTNVVEAFRLGRDLYCEFGNGSGIWTFEITKKTVDERFVCKGVVLGGGFGAGWEAMKRQVRNLAFNLGMDVDVNRFDWPALNAAYREQNPKIKKLWYSTNDALKMLAAGEGSRFGTDGLMQYEVNEMGPALVLPNGLRVWYPNLSWEVVPAQDPEDDPRQELFFDYVRGRSASRRRIYGPKGVENAIQALAGVNIREDWITIVKRARKEIGLKYGSIVNQVHDELIALVRKEVADDYLALMGEVMDTPPTWAPGLPVASEGSIAETYGKAK